MGTGLRSTGGKHKNMLARLLFGFCTFSTSLLMLSMTLFIRCLPALSQLFLQLIRSWLKVSYLIDKALLSMINPIFRYNLGIDLLNASNRIFATTLLSLALYFLFLLFFNKSFSTWIAACFILHGLLIGYLWEDFFEPEGLHLGERIL